MYVALPLSHHLRILTVHHKIQPSQAGRNHDEDYSNLPMNTRKKKEILLSYEAPRIRNRKKLAKRLLLASQQKTNNLENSSTFQHYLKELTSQHLNTSGIDMHEFVDTCTPIRIQNDKVRLYFKKHLPYTNQETNRKFQTEQTMWCFLYLITAESSKTIVYKSQSGASLR